VLLPLRSCPSDLGSVDKKFLKSGRLLARFVLAATDLVSVGLLEGVKAMRKGWLLWAVFVGCALTFRCSANLNGWDANVKTRSTFFNHERVQRLRRNIDRYGWAKETAQRIVKAAEFWRRMSDDELWSLMFSPTITRSGMCGPIVFVGCAKIWAR